MSYDLPYSESAEVAVLCSMLSSDDMQGTGLEKLSPRDFYVRKNREIFSAVSELHETSTFADAVTLAEYLKQNNKLKEAGGVEYISSLLDGGYSSAGFDQYVTIVRNKGLQRRVLEAASKIMDKAKSSPYDEVSELVNESEQLIFEVTAVNDSSMPERVDGVILPTIARIEERMKRGDMVTGYRVGIDSYDKMTAGLQAGQLNILAARPAMGKTALALQMAAYLSIHEQVPVYLFELEMSKEDLVERILSQLSLVDHVRLRAGKLEAHHTKRMGDAAHLLSTAKLFIDDNPNLSASDLRTKCRRLVKQHGPGVIIVDYLQLMTIPGDNRNEGVGKVSRAAKLLARELECPVIMLSQLSRGPESREDKRPRLSDLRDSGSIEQDADNVIFLYRPEVYYGKVDSAGNELEGAAELIVGKQRNGPIGIVKTNFSKRLMLFHEPNNEPTQDR